MEKYTEHIVTSKDSYPLSVRVYNAENPKAIIKFIHGMEEHQGRYEKFASYLAENGYIVVTSDMRGHGKSAKKLSHIADKNGEKLLIEDEIAMRQFIVDELPSLPVYLFAHSMGTIIGRVLLQTESLKFQKVALSGYPNYQSAVGMGIAISKVLRDIKGPDKYSTLLTNLSLGKYAKSIKDRKTVLDWISYNEENCAEYEKDPLSGEEFTIASYNALFKLVKKLHDYKHCKNINSNLELFLCSGIDDPCTGGPKGRKDSLQTLKKYGFSKIDEKVFDHMRHEILNEKEKEKVYQSILNFFN